MMMEMKGIAQDDDDDVGRIVRKGIEEDKRSERW